MVVSTDTTDVTSSGVTDVTQARIVASAQMIKLLSSGLYQDKILAVLRELSANAVDAMTVAGTLESHKFEVHLPTTLESWFSIRDYGTGLSDEGMKRVYINYGSSTKSSDNEQIGGFGVGSKAPFAYCKQYTITSYYNGTQTAYNYGIGASGIPELSKISTRPTDLHNGLEIHLAVETKDITAFTVRAQRLFMFFKHKPDTNMQLDYPDREVVYECSAGSIEEIRDSKNPYTNSYAGLYVKMSGIVYKVQRDLWNYGEGIYSAASNFCITFNADIGEVEVTASREGVESTPHNKKIIDTKYAEMSDSLVEWINNKLGSVEKWERAKLIHSMKKLPSNIRHRTSIEDSPGVISPTGISFRRTKVHGTKKFTLENPLSITPGACDVLILCDSSIPVSRIHDILIKEYSAPAKPVHVWFVYPSGGFSKGTTTVSPQQMLHALGGPKEYMLLSDLLSKYTDLLPTKEASVCYNDIPLYTTNTRRHSVLFGLPDTMTGPYDYQTSVTRLNENMTWFYYVDPGVYCDAYYIDTLKLILDNKLGPHTYELVMIAKSNLSKIKRVEDMISVVEFINEADITVTNVQQLIDCIPKNDVAHEQLQCICNVYDSKTLPKTHAMKNALEMCSQTIIGDDISIERMHKMGIHFNVVNYKVPKILKDYKHRFSLYTTLNKLAIKEVAMATIACESISPGILSTHTTTNYTEIAKSIGGLRAH